MKIETQAQKSQPVQQKDVSTDVRAAFENKYGKRIRGGEKKMTSIGSTDFFGDGESETMTRSQYQNATSLGSDAFFGRKEALPKSQPGDLNWDDMRDEAAQKVDKLTQAASSWFSSLT